MTDKCIKSETWGIKELVGKIDNKKIIKPKFQRKKKWDIQPKKSNSPNERHFIEFLFKNKNSVHSITFGSITINNIEIFSNIDGNNRINAIKHFMDKPFEIFPDYLNDLNKIIETGTDHKENEILQSYNFDDSKVDEMKEFFKSLNYPEFIKIGGISKFLKTKGKQDLINFLSLSFSDKIESETDSIREKLLIPNTNASELGEGDRFDMVVKINVNIFQGYCIDELSDVFENINRYNSNLTQIELLASKLFNHNSFVIEDNVFKTELENSIKKYYKLKSENEALKCYVFDPKDNINAHDFIVGFQNLFSEKYNFISETDYKGLSLFFKLYKALYKLENSFTNENVNEFIKKITKSCNILNKTIENIFTEQINDSLFNKTCLKKLQTLKKNNLYMIIIAIIGYLNKETDEKNIIKSLEKCLIFHFFIIGINDKSQKLIIEKLQYLDKIIYRSGGDTESLVKNLLKNPELISENITKDSFIELIDFLINSLNRPHKRYLENGKKKNESRRGLNFFAKTLMFFYYRSKVPTEMLKNNFSLEHIFPNSSDWDGELDKDRLGNLIPIIEEINCSRQNKHIKKYRERPIGEKFLSFIKDCIPEDSKYDNIIKHENRKCKIINNKLYNDSCKANEKIYKDNLIKYLYD
tara:strand:+ start:672 stop:2594 length:1923 start_codon:yes stop_codon:yes gene_type:complete